MKRPRLRAKSETRTADGTDGTTLQLLPFGPPALFESEDASAYNDLLSRISSAIKPTNIIEEIWTREYADLTWEVFRLRRLKTALLTASAHIGLEVVLKPMVDEGLVELVDAWARGEPQAIQRVKRILNAANLSMDAVLAQTVFEQIDKLERIERMLATVEARRNAVLREIDRYRTARRDVDEVERHQLQIIDMKPDGAKSAA